VRRNATRPDYPDSQLHKFASVYLGYLDDSDPGSGYNLGASSLLLLSLRSRAAS